MVVILGLGFTGARLARRLLSRGARVSAAVRESARFRDLAKAGLELVELDLLKPGLPGRTPLPLPESAVVFHAIPPLAAAENAALRLSIERLRPRRVVYVSSTGVYGDRETVDETTAPEPTNERGRTRLEEERWIQAGPWNSLILRAAAIYGPGRGVHRAVRESRLPRPAGAGIVSRIHVDDLVALADAGIFSELQGAWPVADELPCPSAEIIEWCGGVFDPGAVGQMTGRSVGGAAIRERLKVKLIYPSWKTGIPASLDEERRSGEN